MCKEWNTNKYYIFNIVGMALSKKITSTNKLLCIIYEDIYYITNILYKFIYFKNEKKCEKKLL